MQYEVIENIDHPGDWRAEAIGPEGEYCVAIFCGPKAKERAERYAATEMQTPVERALAAIRAVGVDAAEWKELAEGQRGGSFPRSKS